jgi:hypothetical protein
LSQDRYHIAISVPDGRTVRDFLYNGLLDQLGQAGARVTLFTEAVNVPAFVEQWSAEHVRFERFWPVRFTKNQLRSLKIRSRLEKRKLDSLVQPYRRFESRRLFQSRPEYVRAFEADRPDLVVITNIYQQEELEFFHTARHSGIPTLGIVRSWDNVHRPLFLYTDDIAVWSETNRSEVIEFARYDPSRVHVTGAAQFDPYFQNGHVWTREQTAAHFDLDPTRPIIVFATMGFYSFAVEETGWMDALLCIKDDLPGHPQIICRLHPLSRLEHFQKYADHPDVRLSYNTQYIPSLQWTMTHAEIVAIGNMLRHADVLITPASTMTIEAAIFDTPTVITFFHPYQHERSLAFFSKISGKHWGWAVRNKLLPIVRDRDDFAPTISRCLENPTWYQDERARLVHDFVHYTDGRSIQRLVDLITTLAV